MACWAESSNVTRVCGRQIGSSRGGSGIPFSMLALHLGSSRRTANLKWLTRARARAHAHTHTHTHTSCVPVRALPSEFGLATVQCLVDIEHL